jgi:hypothetical protein
MSLFLLKRVGNATRDQEVVTYLLIPSLKETILYGPLHQVVLLGNCWRLRRDRPYVVINTIEEPPVTGSDDVAYLASIPRLIAEDSNHVGVLRYVGQGDLSPFVPRAEEDFMLFLQHPPPKDIPSWPLLVTQLNAVLLCQSDEFIKIQTVDPSIMRLIEALPSG